MKDKVVVYTAIFGEKDRLKDPPGKLQGCDLVCFTDNTGLRSEAFEVRFRPPTHPDPARNAMIFKILPHQFLRDYEYSLWIDGSVIIKTSDIRGLVDRYLRDYDMAFFAHPDRDCIYDEAEASIPLDYDGEGIIRKQMEEYRNQGYPAHNGLVATGIILRRHLSPDVVRVDEAWWAEIEKFCRRDQLSFNYVAWKNHFRYGIIPGSVWDNEYFRVVEHLTGPTPTPTSERFLERANSRFVTMLLDIYLRRPDLREEFKGALGGDLSELIGWAHAHSSAGDGESAKLSRYDFLYALFTVYYSSPELLRNYPFAIEKPEPLIKWAEQRVVEDKTKDLLSGYAAELTLLDVYYRRGDLRTAIPGALLTDERFKLLLEWAVNHGCEEDGAHERLRPFADRYRQLLSKWQQKPLA